MSKFNELIYVTEDNDKREKFLNEITDKDYSTGSLVLDKICWWRDDKDTDWYNLLEKVKTKYCNVAITLKDADNVSCIFSPGHPQSNSWYIKHPLSIHHPEKFGVMYISIKEFKKYILEEKKAELIKLLTDLGATLIEMEEINKQGNQSDNSYDYKGEAQGSKTEVQAKNSDSTSSNSSNKIIIKLKGKKWFEGDSINESDYHWLHYEPSWKSFCDTRINGGALSADIMIESTEYSSEVSSFMSDVNYTYQVASVGATIKSDASNNSTLSSSLKIKVEFNEPLQK